MSEIDKLPEPSADKPGSGIPLERVRQILWDMHDHPHITDEELEALHAADDYLLWTGSTLVTLLLEHDGELAFHEETYSRMRDLWGNCRIESERQEETPEWITIRLVKRAR